MLLEQKRSWETRRNPDTAKITEINNKIAAVNSQLSGWQNGVMGQLTNLGYKMDILANHINTITETQNTENPYIVPYPIEEKPDSVGSYSDKAYFANQDVSNILQDGVTLYAPDENDPDQDNLKEAWEVDAERVEVLDPTQVFDGSKYVADEIQTAKNLMTV